jgi:hypothetical protein
MFKTIRSKIIAWLLSLIGLAAASTTVVPYQQFMPGLSSVGGILSGAGGAGGGGGGGAGVATINFLQCAGDDTERSVYTFSGQNTGTANTSRDTIVVILAEDSGGTFGISGVTIGGDAATEIVDDDGTVEVSSGIYIFSNDAGTSEDIVVTFSESIFRAAICVYSAYDLTSTTAVASTEAANTEATSLALSINFTGEGVAVGGCVADVSGESVTWTGLVEDIESGTMGGGGTSYSAAKYSSLSTSAPLSATCDWSGNNDVSGVSASFR